MEELINHWIIRSILRPLLDIVLLAYILYRAYRILFQTKAIPLIRGIVFMILIYLVAVGLQLETMNWILNFLAPGIVVGLAIIFQPEIRRIFSQLGQGGLINSPGKTKAAEVETVMASAEMLSGLRYGALIVFSRKVGLKEYFQKAGTVLNAELTSSLLTTLFYKDTPLHDGAVIINGDKIQTAGCFLPLTEQANIKKNFGTRHRAALGLAEETDAVILIVSEETGAISLAYDGQLFYDLESKEAERRLRLLLQFQPIDIQEVEEDAVETGH